MAEAAMIPVGWIVKGAVVLLAGGLGWGIVHYIRQAEVNRIEADQNAATIHHMAEDYRRAETARQLLQSRFDAARTREHAANRQFNRGEIERLSREDPETLERRINDVTGRLLDDIENAANRHHASPAGP